MTTEVLTNRQRQVLAGVAAGHGHKQIARELEISRCTVKQHLVFARAAMQARTSVEAAIKATKAGLL
jgi:DNA-binding NarL/FixJ family response regulator